MQISLCKLNCYLFFFNYWDYNHRTQGVHPNCKVKPELQAWLTYSRLLGVNWLLLPTDFMNWLSIFPHSKEETQLYRPLTRSSSSLLLFFTCLTPNICAKDDVLV